MAESDLRLGCDIGGTFTDFVLLDARTGTIHTHKCLTTPADPAEAVEEGILALEARLGGVAGVLSELIHGTTLVINAIIERKGARTGLITTAGFRDVLELGREIRYAPYDIFAGFPKPLVPRHLRMEVDERIRADGTILEPVDRDQAESVAQELLGKGVQSFAVCLINSFANPVHELAVKEIIRELVPEVPVSVSFEVLPQIREYERTSTTVTNAYVQPLTDRYLRRLEESLVGLGFHGRLFIMLSSGGITSVETAARFPVRIIESGPTAAVIAGQYYGRLHGIREMFCFDMGGTTAKSCLIQDGVAGVVPTFEVGRVQRFMRGSGLSIQVPVVDLMEIGAGGGSIARVSRFGTLQVGPESSGAEPGPICYSRGGREPCVTDADLVLGYLDPEYFLGGVMPLDRKAARRGIEERIAGPLGVPFMHAVWGIHDVINETMAAAAKTHIAEKGGNPSVVTVAAFGGAGPVHAWGLATKLGAPRIMVPPSAGVGSALGFFTAPRAFDLVRSHKVALDDADLPAIETLFQEMEAEGVRALQAEQTPDEVRFERSLDARFRGQGAETTIAIPQGSLDRDRLRQRFDEVYEGLYGRTYPDCPLELVSFRVRASLPVDLLDLPRLRLPGTDLKAAIKGQRSAYCPVARELVPHTVYDRYSLFDGARFAGPAIVEERESTIVVGTAGEVSVDSYGFVWIDLSGGG
jgi:N-methylhydantoinase A/oxoprolinase/acetone carboxylase beta subunit